MMVEHGPKVMASAEAYADGSLSAEDIFQETFIKAWRELAGIQDDRCVAGWLCQTALNLGRDHWRREERRRLLLSLWIRPTQPAPPRTVGRELARRALWRAIGALPPRQRSAVMMKFIDGLNSTEIGGLMGIKPASVRATIRDAQKSLRESLGVDNDSDPLLDATDGELEQAAL